MMRRTLLAFALAAFGFSGVAHADTISPGVYNLYDAYVAGYSVTGTLNVKSSGMIASSHLTFNDPDVANIELPFFNVVDVTNVHDGLSENYLTTKTSSGQITLYFNTVADENGNLNLCIGNAQCGTSPGTADPSTLQVFAFNNPASGSNAGLQESQFTSGYLSQNELTTAAPSVVSEPLSVLLVGTGILGLAAATRLRRT